jgi:hypothetical protein
MLPVWGGAPGPLLVRVQRIQSRILKCIFHKPLQFPTKVLFEQVVPPNVLKLTQLADFEAINFIYKLKNGLIKCNLLLRSNFEVTGRVTRGSQLLRRGDFISTLGQQSVFFRGITLYNKTPTDIRSIPGHGKFKQKLREYLRTSSACSMD